MLREHAQAEACVKRDRVDPRKPAGVASLLLELLDATEPDVRLAPRFVCVHPARTQALGFHVDVEAHFVAHLSLDLVRAPERPPHHPHPLRDSVHQSPNYDRSVVNVPLSCKGESAYRRARGRSSTTRRPPFVK